MDYAVLTEVCKLLSPFADVTMRLEAEDTPTSSVVIPAVIGIISKLAKTTTPHCTSLKTGLTVSLEKRLGTIRTDPHYIISTVLDPRFKMKWIDGQTEDARVRLVMTESIETQLRQQASHASKFLTVWCLLTTATTSSYEI